MADNVTLNAGTGGATFATDDIAGTHHPLVKVEFGAADAATPVSAANPLPTTGTITGTVTVDSELPAAAALADNAANPTAPATGAFGMVWDGAGWDRAAGTSVDGALVNLGTNNDVTVTGTVTSNAGTGTRPVAGDVAHDGVDSGNPVKIGGKARTATPTAVAAADRVDAMLDTVGRQVVANQALHEDLVQGATAAITGTADTAVIAAGASGVRNYVTALTVINSHATVGTVVEIKDGSITVIHRGYAAPAGGGYTLSLPTPLRGTAATAINAACITTASNVYVSASGYRSAV